MYIHLLVFKKISCHNVGTQFCTRVIPKLVLPSPSLLICSITFFLHFHQVATELQIQVATELQVQVASELPVQV